MVLIILALWFAFIVLCLIALGGILSLVTQKESTPQEKAAFLVIIPAVLVGIVVIGKILFQGQFIL